MGCMEVTEELESCQNLVCSLVVRSLSQDVIVTVGWEDSFDSISGETLYETQSDRNSRPNHCCIG